MLTSDSDCYYTPPRLAAEMVASLGTTRLAAILDSACGTGELLTAAEQLYPNARLFGIDRDGATIARLRRRKPNWRLLIGDALEVSTWRRRVNGSAMSPADALLLNPPFSMGAAKATEVVAWTHDIQCSLAMAHVLRALEQSCAKVATAVVPESWAYADRDSSARKLIGSQYNVDLVRALKSSTFHGARANGLVVRFEQRSRPGAVVRSNNKKIALSPTAVDVIRGGLPVFQHRRSIRGIPYIHSTALRKIAERKGIDQLPTVHAIPRGLVDGHVVLVPRVGAPQREFVRAVFLPTPCQLSDCVIALRAESKSEVKAVETAVLHHFRALSNLYRGTGARYVTMTRIHHFIKTYL